MSDRPGTAHFFLTRFVLRQTQNIFHRREIWINSLIWKEWPLRSAVDDEKILRQNAIINWVFELKLPGCYRHAKPRNLFAIFVEIPVLLLLVFFGNVCMSNQKFLMLTICYCFDNIISCVLKWWQVDFDEVIAKVFGARKKGEKQSKFIAIHVDWFGGERRHW